MNLLNFLTRTDEHPASYLFKAWILAMAGHIAGLIFIGSYISEEPDPNNALGGVVIVFFFLVIWPFIITGLLAGTLSITKTITPTYWHAALLSAFAVSTLLGTVFGFGFFIAYIWPTFIGAVAFLAWQMHTNTLAWAMTVALNAGVNILLTVSLL